MNDGYQSTTSKVDVLLELDNMLHDILKGHDLESLSDYDKSRLVYDYLVNITKYDEDLLKQKKEILSKKSNDERMTLPRMPQPHEQINNFFTRYKKERCAKAYCSTIAQIYKMLLEKLNIQAVAVIGYDGSEIHQFNLVKRNDLWSFDDITLAILSNDKEGYFDYEDPREKNQRVEGVMATDLYDMFLGINIPRAKYNEPALMSGLYQLPDLDTIRSHKGNQRKAS